MTKRARRPQWTLGLLALAVALPVFVAGSAKPQKPSLQGTWKLNEDLTARMRETDRGGPGGFRGGMGRGSGGFPGRRGGFPGGPPAGNPEGGPGGDRRREGPRAAIAALDELTIAQKDGEVTITDKEGHARVLKTDGSKVRDEKATGGPAELRASWQKDGTLAVEVKPDEGPRRTESYVVSNDGKHLYLTVTMEGFGDRPAFNIRRAYDPASEAKPTPD